MIDALRALIGREHPSRETTPETGTEGDLSEAATDDDRALARDLLTAELETAEARFRTRWAQADLQGSIDALRAWHGWRMALASLERGGHTDGLTVHIDAAVLTDCYATVFAEPATESITYLTGLVLDRNKQTLNRCLPVEHTVQSAIRAEGDPDASFAILRELDRTGHRLLGHCHNQPGTGPAATRPSSTDRAYQQRLEDAGYDAIGVIMSRDGYVRCFSNDLPFTVEVHGNHVRSEPKPHVFRLEEPTRRPLPTVDA